MQNHQLKSFPVIICLFMWALSYGVIIVTDAYTSTYMTNLQYIQCPHDNVTNTAIILTPFSWWHNTTGNICISNTLKCIPYNAFMDLIFFVCIPPFIFPIFTMILVYKVRHNDKWCANNATLIGACISTVFYVLRIIFFPCILVKFIFCVYVTAATGIIFFPTVAHCMLINRRHTSPNRNMFTLVHSMYDTDKNGILDAISVNPGVATLTENV